MIVRTIDTKRIFRIQLKYWKVTIPDYEEEWTIDQLGLYEQEFPKTHPVDQNGWIHATQNEVDQLIAWWREETHKVNIGIQGSILKALNGDSIRKEEEYLLSAEELIVA